MKTLILAAMIIALGIPGISCAQDNTAPPPPPTMAPPPHLMQACGADIQTLCPNATTPMDKHKCIMASADRASEGCRTAISIVSGEANTFRTACGADFRQYCKGVAPGPAHRQCVAQNLTQFSAACQAELARRPGLTRP